MSMFCLFPGIHPDDEGVYTCIAQNAFGLADAAAYVTVTGIGKSSWGQKAGLVSYGFVH